MPDNPITGRPSAPVQDVFGGERQTPHARFAQARAEGGWTPENPSGNVVTNHRPNDLALACPRCAAAGEADVRMFSREGVGYYCIKANHTWKDIDELMGENPQKLPYRGHVTKQIGFQKVEVEVPPHVAEAFMKRFGDRGAATLASVMNVLSQPKAMLLGPADLQNIEERLGEPVTNPAFIAGKLFTLKTQLAEAEERVRQLQANLQNVARGSRVSDSTVVVDLGDELAGKVRAAAEAREWSMESYITESTRLGVEGGWV